MASIAATDQADDDHADVVTSQNLDNERREVEEEERAPAYDDVVASTNHTEEEDAAAASVTSSHEPEEVEQAEVAPAEPEVGRLPATDADAAAVSWL